VDALHLAHHMAARLGIEITQQVFDGHRHHLRY
jgi:hypothetical protein